LSYCQAYPRANLSAFDFCIFINDLCDIINHSNCLLFADDLKARQTTTSPNDCLLLQSDIDCAHEWSSANFMKPKFSEITVIAFIWKTNVLNYQYRLGNSFTLQTNGTEDLGVLIVNIIFITM
jgi:hypothetical protein